MAIPAWIKSYIYMLVKYSKDISTKYDTYCVPPKPYQKWRCLEEVEFLVIKNTWTNHQGFLEKMSKFRVLGNRFETTHFDKLKKAIHESGRIYGLPWQIIAKFENWNCLETHPITMAIPAWIKSYIYMLVKYSKDISTKYDTYCVPPKPYQKWRCLEEVEILVRKNTWTNHQGFLEKISKFRVLGNRFETTYFHKLKKAIRESGRI